MWAGEQRLSRVNSLLTLSEVIVKDMFSASSYFTLQLWRVMCR